MISAKDGPPLNPYLVLVLAIVLPGAGHVAVRQPQRGLGFAFFAVLLALLSWLYDHAGTLVHRAHRRRPIRLGAFDPRCL